MLDASPHQSNEPRTDGNHTQELNPESTRDGGAHSELHPERQAAVQAAPGGHADTNHQAQRLQQAREIINTYPKPAISTVDVALVPEQVVAVEPKSEIISAVTDDFKTGYERLSARLPRVSDRSGLPFWLKSRQQTERDIEPFKLKLGGEVAQEGHYKIETTYAVSARANTVRESVVTAIEHNGARPNVETAVSVWSNSERITRLLLSPPQSTRPDQGSPASELYGSLSDTSKFLVAAGASIELADDGEFEISIGDNPNTAVSLSYKNDTNVFSPSKQGNVELPPFPKQISGADMTSAIAELIDVYIPKPPDVSRMLG